MALLKLADKYGISRLESACSRAISFTPRPTYKIVKNILSTGQDHIKEDCPADDEPDDRFGFTRGAEYYGGKTK
jgi:hypothetical protein